MPPRPSFRHLSQKLTGRAKKRFVYNRRFVSVVPACLEPSQVAYLRLPSGQKERFYEPSGAMC